MKVVPKIHHSQWATHLSFYTFPSEKEIFVPKNELQNFADLLEILEIETNIKMENINLAINYVVVSYPWSTPIQDFEVKKTDLCLVLEKPKCKNQREREQAIKEQKKNQKKSTDRLNAKLQNPEYKQLVNAVYESSEKEKKIKLLRQLCRQYSKDQCLYALCDYGDDLNKARAALKSGECLRKVERRVFQEERAYLEKFLTHSNQKDIQKLLRENNNPLIFIKIMQKLCNRQPKFKEIEPKHQVFVQKFLFGRTLEPEQDDGPDEVGLESDVTKALWKVEGLKRLRQLVYEDEHKFRATLKDQGKEQQEINQIFKISHNNIDWAEALLKAEEMDSSEKINSFCLKKSNRINLVMHFFSHPKFYKITESLRGDQKKADNFITNVLQKIKQNTTLHHLIKQYRQQAIILLSGINISKEKDSKNEAIDIEFEPVLSIEEQKKERQTIENSYNKELFDILRRKQVNTVLAASSLRATESKLEEMTKYLALGGINRTFDFCPAGQKPEQIYIYKKWRKQKSLLKKLKTTKDYNSWLAHIKEVRPLMYDMIIRNKRFFDKMVVQGEVEKK